MMKHSIFIFTCMILLSFMSACSRPACVRQKYDTVFYAPEYASGFDIVGFHGSRSRIIRVKCAWQGADSTAVELFVSKEGEKPPCWFSGQVIDDHAARIAVMSSSYVGLISGLGACDSIVAISGKNFISDKSIRGRLEDILEIGPDSDPDYEGLLSRGVDLVLIYGISSSSPMERRLENLGIPYFYMGEYIEQDPLGKTEWIVALAEILGVPEKGVSVFKSIEQRYVSLKAKADSLAHRGEQPLVMMNVPYGDTWFMASPRSAIVRMVEDAGGEYVFRGHNTNMSVPIDREKAFVLASEADIWLDTGSVGSIDEFNRVCPGFSSVKSVLNGRIYNSDARRGSGGGNEFWENSIVHPDIVLEDLLRIMHPEFMGKEDTLYYYRRLN